MKKFCVCRKCGNMVGMIHTSGVPLMCCGEPMADLTPNTVEASQEKHLPVVTVDGDTVTVKVGSATHPMLEEHFITWIYLQTENGGQRKILKAGDAPEAKFTLNGDTPVAAYAHCNLHGLWMTKI